MIARKCSYISKIIALILIFSLVLPHTVSADTVDPVQPRASYFLSAYSAYVYVSPTGEVQVWFDVMGTGDMDEIGALSIRVYESTNGLDWTRVKTFLHEDRDDMLFYDDWYVSSHVSFQGSVNKQYKAIVGVWAGKNGEGDTRYFWAYQP